MRGRSLLAAWLLASVGCGGGSSPTEPAADALAVLRMVPAARSVAADPAAPVVLHFDRPVRRDSVVLDRTVHVFGRWSGTAAADLAFSDGDRAVAIVPRRRFSAGEVVTVLVGRGVVGTDGTPVREAGWSAQFWTRTLRPSAAWAETQRFSTRTGGFALSRAYGGVATDLDGDGQLDITIVNEDSADLAVFMNRGGSFVGSTARYAVGTRASPSESGDFDRDGRTDIAVANIGAGTVSVWRGRGDGTYGEPQTIAVGTTPRGIAGLDVDGDADLDLAVANVGANDVAILTNDGGRFAVTSRVDTGAAGEWAIGATDLDEDGVLDLVVGASTDRRVVGLRNLGGGRFSPMPAQEAGGAPWQVATGDLDGDGHDDVALANGRSNTASVLRGDGRGGFGPPLMAGVDPFVLASDLGDLDGDGDLDWVTSSYDGDWRVFENLGAGVFRPGVEVTPTSTASCALLFDADGDGDLDVALIDEEADEVVILMSR
jgi:hypothetical protein